MSENEILEFGPFRLVPSQRLLTRDGQPVALGSRTFDVLNILAANAPRVIDKRTLIEQVWSDRDVDEVSIRVAILALRKALGENEDQSYIKNVTGRGYYFVKPVALAGRLPERSAPTEAVGSGPRTNLSQSPSSLVGRERDLVEVSAHLGRSRLVTLTGPGGVGKTRLAVELGRRLLDTYPGGVWLVDLTPLTDPAAVASTAATVLGAVFSSAVPAVDAIVAALGNEPRLLIFDNCEHLVGATATLIDALLQRAPGLIVLATSQEALRIASEQVYPVQPLVAPPVEAVEIGGFSAVALFADRVRRFDETFYLGPENAADVSEICRCLDGVPLALEMAAARVRLLGVKALRANLDHRLKMLKGSHRAGGARYESLQAVMEWSFGLLEPEDQHLFLCLAVFQGGFSLDGAVAVAGKAESDPWAVLDSLGQLVEKSLLVAEGHDRIRYRLLETPRLFAADRLRASGEEEAIAERHARYLAAVMRSAELAWETIPDPEWLQFYLPELDNLRRALEWALAEPGRHKTALELGGPSVHLFHVASLLAEGRRYFERLVALVGPDTSPAIEAILLLQAGYLWSNEAHPEALARADRAVELYRALDDRPRLATAVCRFYLLSLRQGILSREEWLLKAGAAIEEAWTSLGNRDQKKTRLNLMQCRAFIVEFMGDYDLCRAYHLQAVEMARALKSVNEVTHLNNLALAYYLAGDVAGAIERGKEAISCGKWTPSHRSLGYALINQTAYLLADGRSDEARSHAEEAFPRLVEHGSMNTPALQVYAVFSAFEGRLSEAACLIGLVEEERVRANRPREPAERRLFDELTRRLESGLAPDRLIALSKEGAGWSRAEAIAFVENRILRNPPLEPGVGSATSAQSAVAGAKE